MELDEFDDPERARRIIREQINCICPEWWKMDYDVYAGEGDSDVILKCNNCGGGTTIPFEKVKEIAESA